MKNFGVFPEKQYKYALTHIKVEFMIGRV